jgi:hypothetical protein
MRSLHSVLLAGTGNMPDLADRNRERRIPEVRHRIRDIYTLLDKVRRAIRDKRIDGAADIERALGRWAAPEPSSAAA